MSERLAYSRKFNEYGATINRTVGQGLAMGFYYSGSDATVAYVYIFTKNNDNINVSVSIRAVDGEDLPIAPDLVVTSVNLQNGVMVGNDYGETNPVYRHIATLPLSISDGVHYAIVLLPTSDTVTHWLTFRNREWDLGQYEKDEGSRNWVNRWMSSVDGGSSWAKGGPPTSWMNFEVYGEEFAPSAPTVITNPATAVEATTSTLNGNITDNGGEDCDKRGFVYNTSPHGDPGDTAPADSEYSNYIEETDSFGTGAFTGALTSLEPKTTYYIRAYAHNSAGYSYGNELSFTTLTGLPTVTTDAVSDLSAIAATLNGTLASDGGEACECGFEWGPDTGYGVTTPTQSKVKDETFSQVIRGLFPETTYHFRAFATNSAGTDYGADRTFTTKPVISRAYALAREEL